MKLWILLVLTTFFWGISAIFDKAALGKGTPLSGMMVRQIITTGVLFLAVAGYGRLGSLGSLDLRSIVFFGLSGICAGVVGLWTYYHALRLGGASLVVPIAATYPLVTAVLSWTILQEGFSVSRLVGTVLIVIGIWLVK